MDLDVGPALALQLSAVVLSFITAMTIHHLAERRGLLPPYLRPGVRRVLASGALAFFFYVLVWGPLASWGEQSEASVSPDTPIPLLFAGHALMLATLLTWYVLAFEPGRGERPQRRFVDQLGLRSAGAWDDVLFGIAGAGAAWVGMIVVMLLVVSLSIALFGKDAVPQQVPSAIAFMAGLPWGVRLALGLSAGLVEEIFFRGFLQARVGIALSTGLFVLGHAGYQQPFMLVGLVVISLVLAGLVRWRQSIWPAVIAHALFDLVQLLVIIPAALRLTGAGALPVS